MTGLRHTGQIRSQVTRMPWPWIWWYRWTTTCRVPECAWKWKRRRCMHCVLKFSSAFRSDQVSQDRGMRSTSRTGSIPEGSTKSSDRSLAPSRNDSGLSARFNMNSQSSSWFTRLDNSIASCTLHVSRDASPHLSIYPFDSARTQFHVSRVDCRERNTSPTLWTESSVDSFEETQDKEGCVWYTNEFASREISRTCVFVVVRFVWQQKGTKTPRTNSDYCMYFFGFKNMRRYFIWISESWERSRTALSTGILSRFRIIKRCVPLCPDEGEVPDSLPDCHKRLCVSSIANTFRGTRAVRGLWDEFEVHCCAYRSSIQHRKRPLSSTARRFVFSSKLYCFQHGSAFRITFEIKMFFPSSTTHSRNIFSNPSMFEVARYSFRIISYPCYSIINEEKEYTVTRTRILEAAVRMSGHTLRSCPTFDVSQIRRSTSPRAYLFRHRFLYWKTWKRDRSKTTRHESSSWNSRVRTCRIPRIVILELWICHRSKDPSRYSRSFRNDSVSRAIVCDLWYSLVLPRQRLLMPQHIRSCLYDVASSLSCRSARNLEVRVNPTTPPHRYL